MKAYKLCAGFLVAFGFWFPAGATEYFVEKGGGDHNPGTRMQPFRTIQQAVGVMVAGDICTVSRGLYRETVRPIKSGTPGNSITIRAAAGESVTISGADEMNGWESVSRGVYRVKVARVIQVLVDESPVTACRTIPSGTSGPGTGWYYDVAGGCLYVKLADHDSPDQRHIEIQTRAWGIDAGGLSHIQVKGFNLMACGANLMNAKACSLDDCHFWWNGGSEVPTNMTSGSLPALPFPVTVLLGGKENEMVNSSMVGCMGCGVVLTPDSVNNRLINILIRGGAHTQPEAMGILAQGTAPVIRNVSVLNYPGGALLCSNVLNAQIENNDFHHGGGGLTNSSLVTLAGDGKGTVLACNWIHDNAAVAGVGIRLGKTVENYVLRQNVIWGQPGAAFSLAGGSRYNFIFNNTCALNGSGIDLEASDANTDLRATRVVNNIMAGAVWPSCGGTAPGKVEWKKNFTGINPGFMDETNRNFRLAAGSPCVDAGQEEPEFTDEFTGNLPDMGAYEFGKDTPTQGCHVTERANMAVAPVVKVIVESETDGSEIRYTLDGRTPDLTSPLYTGPVPVEKGILVKAKAFRAGMEESTSSCASVTRME